MVRLRGAGARCALGVIPVALLVASVNAAAQDAPAEPPAQGSPPPGYAPPPGYPPPGNYYPPPTGYYPAGPAGPPPGHHMHDGTYVRLFLGGGRIAISESVGGQDGKVHGGGVSFGVAVGGAVVENLILYGEFYFMSADDPTVELGGVSLPASGSSLVSAGIGPGIAYYIQPVNIYLSATFGAARVEIQDADTQAVRGSSKWGLGLSTMIGKEFWVSDNWGLGAALQFHYGSMEDNVPSPAPTIRSNAIALLFSSTFN
jgi:hypothetical protein